VAVGVLAGCSSGSKSTTSTTTKSTTPARFEAGPCPAPEPPVDALKTARCGVLVVPENRTKNNGRTIKLAVVTLPAASPNKKPDPIVYLEGGPGSNALGAIEFLEAGGINRDRDVIVVTQRGTPFADPVLECPEVTAFNARAVGLVYDAPSTGTEHVAATKACHDRLVKAGLDISAYNTPEDAADIADLKTTMGIQQMNLYGTSYGTYVALTMTRTHPQGIRSVMIDSVVPPDKGSLSGTWVSVQEATTNLFKACDAQPGCHDRYPNLADEWTRLVSDLEAKPVTTTVTPPQGGAPVKVVIDGGALISWLTAVPFSQAPQAIDALAKGNPELMATRIAGATGPQEPSGYGVANSVFCSEWIPYEPQSAILAQGKRSFPTYPDSVLSQAPQLPFMHDDCGVWKVPKASASVRTPARSAIPTLLVAGNLDIKTSPQQTKYQAGLMPNATYMEIPGAGHWASIREPCANDVVTAFYDDPAKKPDMSCVASITVPPFK
jgi:pimeloyl-ACP methyl ester carboxylesterase